MSLEQPVNLNLMRVSVRRRQLRSHASAHEPRCAAARAAAVRRACAVLHLQVVRLHGGAAVPCDYTVGRTRA